MRKTLPFKQGSSNWSLRRGKEKKFSLFQISPPKSTWRRKEFIFIAEAICAPDIGKIYRRKSGKCDSDRFAIELGRCEVISAIVVEKTCISIIRQTALSMMCLSLILIIFASLWSNQSCWSSAHLRRDWENSAFSAKSSQVVNSFPLV